MGKNTKKSECCPAPSDLKVEAIVSIDERGQMVLPKEIRDKLGLSPGDKLAVVTRERDGRVCCIHMLRTDELLGMVKDLLGPMLQDLTSTK